MGNGSVPFLSDAFSRYFGFFQHHAEACEVSVEMLDGIKYIDLAAGVSNREVIDRRQIGGLAGVRQTALSFEQAVGLMVLQKTGQHDRLRTNVINSRNRGFMFGADGRLYELRMDVWRPRVIDEEFRLDANSLDEVSWGEGSRIFYNTVPRPQDDTPVELSMSFAHTVLKTDPALTERVSW